jgi:hypothetical protein
MKSEQCKFEAMNNKNKSSRLCAFAVKIKNSFFLRYHFEIQSTFNC